MSRGVASRGVAKTHTPTPHSLLPYLMMHVVLMRRSALLLTLLAFGLRLYKLGRAGLWYDELLQLDIAQGRFSDILPQLVRHAAMPLDYFIAFGWVRLGRQEVWVRYPALLFGTLAVPLIYALGTRLFNRRIGLMAAILMAGASFAVRYSQEARPYAILMAFSLLGFYGLWRAYAGNRLRYWGVAIAGFAGAVLSHYFALFLLLPAGLFVGLQQLYHTRDKRAWQQSAQFGLLLLVVAGLLLWRGHPDKVYSVGKRFAQDLSQPATLAQPAAAKPNGGAGPPLEPEFFLEKIISPLSTIEDGWLLYTQAILLVGLLSLLRRRAAYRQAMLLLLAWAVLPAILIYLLVLARGTFFAPRYILFTLPAYLLLLACGIDRIARSTPRLTQRITKTGAQRSALGGLVAGLLLLPLLRAEQRELRTLYTQTAYEDWRAVGQLLHDNAWEGDAVIAARAEPAMSWYYPPAAAPLDTYSDSQAIWQAMETYTRRWFVLSSYSYKRDAGLRAWLAEQGAVVIPIDRRVTIYFFQEGLDHWDHLSMAQTFTLPPNALTYLELGKQFETAGRLETAQAYYQKAIALAGSDDERRAIQTLLARSFPDD